MSGTGSQNRKSRDRRRVEKASAHRLKRMREQGLKPPLDYGEEAEDLPSRVAVDCGWGRLLFDQTFEQPGDLADALRGEGPDRRDIAIYVRDPHVLLAKAPQELFLDPSHMFRLNLSTYRASRRQPRGFFVRRITSKSDADAINRIYATRHMVQVPPDYFWSHRDASSITYLVAEDDKTGSVMGTVTGVDHKHILSEKGASLWCLAVDPQAPHPGIGEALVRRLAEFYAARGAAHLDLSVLHDNTEAIALYEKLGFERLPYFSVKRKNPFNEELFAGPSVEEGLNPYAMIIVNEARRRGIRVELVDAEGGFFRLTYGGRSVLCRESLSEFTSAVSMSICDDKSVTRRVVAANGVRVPEQVSTAQVDLAAIEAFAERHGKIVVKPARGEQGRGVSVGLTPSDDIAGAIAAAEASSDEVLIEQHVEGDDLRTIVIDYQVVAAAIRRPAHIVGNGRSTVRSLIERQSRRRSAATGGEAKIPLDGETERCVSAAGYSLDQVLPDSVKLDVRQTANLHTGGTIHDVTAILHPELAEAAVTCAKAIDIPVTGLDFIVSSPSDPDYHFIEANERPGLANHEPQPTAERFVDFVFPMSIPSSVRESAAEARE